jgi:2Fe-2S ferredoxin
MHLAHENDIHIQSVCKGLPSCAECRVRVVDGENNVVPPNEKELSLIGTAQFIDQSRLSCQLRCFGDIVVDLSEQVEKAERTVKRPRGKLNRFGDDEDEGQKSRAVMGSLVLTEFDVESMIDDEGEFGSPDAVPAKPPELQKSSFYKEFNSSDKQSSGATKQGASSQRSDRESGSNKRELGTNRDETKGSKGGASSRRRRNRNRRRPGAQNGEGK